MAEKDTPVKRPKKTPLQNFVGFLSGYLLASIVFFLLLVITLLGTLEQEHKGIHEVQEKYFTSFGLVHDLGGFPLPLPGGYLLMAVLFVNLLLGGIIKIRKDWRRSFVVLTHFSILFLIAAAWVTHHYADDGAMRVFEGDRANHFNSYTVWDMAVEKWEDGKPPEKAFVLREEQLLPVNSKSRRVFHSADLPFEIEVRNVMANSSPAFRRASSLDKSAEQKSYDGFYLVRKDPEQQAEQNIPGAEVSLLGKEGDVLGGGLVWGLAQEPLSIKVGDVHWVFRYEKRIFEVPFTIVLDDFEKEDHPGTEMAMRFVSTVRKIEDGAEEKVVIKMNHPLRHKGFTLFQSGFGPSENDPMGTGPYSVFAVWRNPADQWPLWSCYVVAIGMSGHFIMKLMLFLSRTAQNRNRPPEAANQTS